MSGLRFEGGRPSAGHSAHYPRRMSRVSRVAAVVLVLVGLSGCVSRHAGPGSTTETTEPTEQVATADGTDLDACADGTCEVLLTERTSTVPVPGGALTLTVGDAGVEYEISVDGGGVSSGSTQGRCVSTFALDGTGSGSVCHAGGPAPEPDPGPGEMAMVITGQDRGEPVLRLVANP